MLILTTASGHTIISKQFKRSLIDRTEFFQVWIFVASLKKENKAIFFPPNICLNEVILHFQTKLLQTCFSTLPHTKSHFHGQEVPKYEEKAHFVSDAFPWTTEAQQNRSYSRQNLQSHDPASCIVKIFLTTHHFQPNGSSNMDCSNLLHFWQLCKQICSKCIPWQDLGPFKRGEKVFWL